MTLVNPPSQPHQPSTTLTPHHPTQTVDQRRKEGRTPLWAERLGLAGGRRGEQSATIYGHRAEYRPSQKTDARSMVGCGAAAVAAWGRAGWGGAVCWPGRRMWRALEGEPAGDLRCTAPSSSLLACLP